MAICFLIRIDDTLINSRIDTNQVAVQSRTIDLIVNGTVYCMVLEGNGTSVRCNGNMRSIQRTEWKMLVVTTPEHRMKIEGEWNIRRDIVCYCIY